MTTNLPSASKYGSDKSVWAWLTLALWLALATVLVVTRSDYGMSWDEMSRWTSGDNKLRYFEQVLGGDLSVWGTGSGGSLYPGLFDLPLAAYAKYIGGDRVNAGHLYCIFFGVAAVAGAGMLGRELGGWRLAFWASLLLAVVPRFYGHAVFNPKDIPFAATYTWGLWGVLCVAKGFPAGGWGRWIAAGFLAGLAMASRLPGMIILAYLGGLVVYYFASQSILRRSQATLPLASRDWIDGLGGFALAGLLAYGVLMLFFPSSHHNPFADSTRVVSELHEFSTTIPVLFRGAVYDAGTTPWYYTLWMLGITTPTWQLLLLCGGVAVAAWRIAATFRRCKWWDLETIRVGAILLGFGFPLIYLLIAQPAIHNGVRHFLFVFPPAAVLMALALTALTDRLQQQKGVRPAIVFGSFSLGVVFNISALAQLHPYQYVFLNNLAGGPAAALGRYETEYWYTSMGEGMLRLDQWLADQPQPTTPVRVLMTGPREIAEYQLPDGWTLVRPGEPADFFLGNTQFSGDLLVEGPEIIVIERMGLPILVIKDLRQGTP